MSHSAGATAIISATLQRGDTSTSWGFRLRGGVDFNSNIIIERVIIGSLADRCGLRPGDIVRAICGESASHMRHEDAHDAVLRAGNLLKLELQRQTFDESPRSAPAYEDDDRATASSVSWSRSGAGSKARSPYTPVEASSSTLLESYETRRDNDQNGGQESEQSTSVKTPSYAQPYRQPTAKPYERERSKEAAAVVDELKQHGVNSSVTVEQGDGQKKEAPISVRPSVWCPPQRQATQSKSFLMLQSMLESGEEDPKIPKPTPQWHAPVTASYFQPPLSPRQSGFDPTKTIPEHDSLERQASDRGEQSSGLSSTYRSQPPATYVPFTTSASTSTPASRIGQPTAFPFTGRVAPANEFAPPIVPVPRRSPGPRPPPITSPLPHQPRAFRPGAAVRSSAPNPASRIPVCHRCSRNIRGPFVVALDKTWCPEHFLCDKCGCDMVDIGFVETPEGKIFCEDDYGRFFAPRCHRCRQAIIGTIVKALSAEWHTDCFTCAHCNKTIAGGLFHVEDGKPYCEKDYAELFQTKCAGCEFPIEPGDRWVEAAGANYHVTCFACTTCQCSLANRGFVMRNGKPYCTPHSRGL